MIQKGMNFMNYKSLSEVNAKLKTTDIKGKDYIEVNQRIKAFWELCEEGRIETTLLSIENGMCVIKAEVYENKNDEKPRATGTAYEREGSTFINKTSYIENCETSAIGRALGNAGIGIDTSVASAEEVQNAMLQQEDLKKITKTEVATLQALIKGLQEAKQFYDNILVTYKIKDLQELTSKQYGEVLIEIKKIKGE